MVIDLFAREEHVLALAQSKLRDGSAEYRSLYFDIVGEYETLLRQFRVYQQMTGNKASSGPTKERTLFSVNTNRDILTGMYSKRFFLEYLDSTLSSMERAGDVLSMILVNVDSFRTYNDMYGRTAGDECLKIIAQTVKACLFRVHDVVARYSGNEFAVLLPHTNTVGVQLVADRIHSATSHLEIAHEGVNPGIVTLSTGCVTGQKSGGDLLRDAFLRRAEEAVNRAKARGRGNIEYLDLIEEHLGERDE